MACGAAGTFTNMESNPKNMKREKLKQNIRVNISCMRNKGYKFWKQKYSDEW